uniref:Uncharacterized protein n=1 Tax=Arundo donax TaxID=35708 RepID=A0A0A9ASM2_ARUDO
MCSGAAHGAPRVGHAIPSAREATLGADVGPLLIESVAIVLGAGCPSISPGLMS